MKKLDLKEGMLIMDSTTMRLYRVDTLTPGMCGLSRYSTVLKKFIHYGFLPTSYVISSRISINF
jgi:hypothetical protein